MLNKMLLLILLCSGMTFAQAVQSPSNGATRQSLKKQKNQVTVTGCISRLNSAFILMETGAGHSYELQEMKGVKLSPYLGQEVEVTGVETLPMPSSSPRASTANPVNIAVQSIKSIHKRCSN